MIHECGLNVFITRNLFEKMGEADQLKFEQAIPLKKMVLRVTDLYAVWQKLYKFTSVS